MQKFTRHCLANARRSNPLKRSGDHRQGLLEFGRDLCVHPNASAFNYDFEIPACESIYQDHLLDQIVDPRILFDSLVIGSFIPFGGLIEHSTQCGVRRKARWHNVWKMATQNPENID